MVKSKRAREAADAVADSEPAPVTNGSSATPDKSEHKPKKRKRDTEDVNGADDGLTNGEKKSKKDKKEKKEKKDKKKHDKESRKEKKDKRKNLQDLPEEVMEDAEEEEAQQTPSKTKADNAEVQAKEEKRARKQAKREEKKQRKEAEQGTTSTTSKSKDKASASSTVPSTSAETKEDPIDLGEPSTEDATADKKDRHIVFVGNLPFSATAASISAHFASLSPVAVRCLRNRDDPNPCRGIAFVEFGKVWHQRTCLDKFHHSTFDDGVSPPRKINVELT
jgi:nucleolar protein 6